MQRGKKVMKSSAVLPNMHCDPVLAVMSARFSCTANVLCMAALLALAARNEMFLPMIIQEGEGRE
jgi:hypothetical protein